MGLFSRKKVLGGLTVPGEVTLELPEGKVHLHYDEQRRGRELDSWPGQPGGFELTVRPAGGGDPLPIESEASSEFSNLRRIGAKVGKVEVAAAGTYVVAVAPFTSDRELYDPKVTVKA